MQQSTMSLAYGSLITNKTPQELKEELIEANVHAAHTLWKYRHENNLPQTKILSL